MHFFDSQYPIGYREGVAGSADGEERQGLGKLADAKTTALRVSGTVVFLRSPVRLSRS